MIGRDSVLWNLPPAIMRGFNQAKAQNCLEVSRYWADFMRGAELNGKSTVSKCPTYLFDGSLVSISQTI